MNRPSRPQSSKSYSRPSSSYSSRTVSRAEDSDFINFLAPSVIGLDKTVKHADITPNIDSPQPILKPNSAGLSRRPHSALTRPRVSTAPTKLDDSTRLDVASSDNLGNISLNMWGLSDKTSDAPLIASEDSNIQVTESPFPALEPTQSQKKTVADRVLRPPRPTSAALFSRNIRSIGNPNSILSQAVSNNISVQNIQPENTRINFTPTNAQLKSEPSKSFSQYTVNDAILYVVDPVLNKRSENSVFLLVTPRFNVERVSIANFYDLVVLRDSSGYCRKDIDKLDPSKIMTLSSKGLMIPNLDPLIRRDEIIPLDEFVEEMNTVQTVRKFPYFKYFKQNRVFHAWKELIRGTTVSRAKEKLKTHSVYSNVGYVELIRNIRSKLFQIENDIELFYFHGFGSLCITDFIQKQFEFLDKRQKDINDRLLSLLEFISAEYSNATSESRIAEHISYIKRHHPYSHAEEAGVEIDWASLQSVQRIKNDTTEKFGRILIMSQMILDITMARLINKFWVRMSQLLRGISTAEVIQTPNVSFSLWDIADIDTSVPTDLPFTIAEDIQQLLTGSSSSSSSLVANSTAANNDTEDLPNEVVAEDKSAIEIVKKWHYVDTEWENRGCHLSIKVSLTHGDGLTDVDQLLNVTSISKFRVKFVPSRSHMMDKFHGMIRKLGVLLESLPSMKKHSLVKQVCQLAPDPNPDHFEIEEEAMANSAKYFTRLHMYPVLNSFDGIQHCLDNLKNLFLAYNNMMDVSCLLNPLYESFRKLYYLSPDAQTKLLERSLLVPKLREAIDNPDSLSDTVKTLTRERGRLLTLKKAVDYLYNSKNFTLSFPNMKFIHGMVASFEPICDQLRQYRFAQYSRLYGKLPLCYSLRCRQFIDFMKALEHHFDIPNDEYTSLIDFLRRLKHFDSVKPLFDLEQEILDSMYKMILDQAILYKENEGIELDVRDSSNSPSKSVSSARQDVLALNRIYEESRIKLFERISKLRSILLSGVVQLRTLTDLKKKHLLESVKTSHVNIFTNPPVSDSVDIDDIEPIDIFNRIKNVSNGVSQLRKDIDNMISIQNLLVDGQDIVGAADPLYLPAEIERFSDIEQIEQLCVLRTKAWDAIVDAAQVRRKLLSSRLAMCDVAWMNNQLDNFSGILGFLQQRLNETGTIRMLHSLFHDLSPKVLVASCLASNCLRVRHWKWLADNVFSFCGISVRFSVPGGEVMTAIDVTTRSPTNLGTLTRVPFYELVQRGIEKNVDRIVMITSEAGIEFMIEEALSLVDEVMKSIIVKMSMEWLRDSKLREKIFFELNEAVNLVQIRVLIEYCIKTVLILENTSHDMSLNFFDPQMEKQLVLLRKIDKFVSDYILIQQEWYDCFGVVKFCPAIELDKDTPRLFQMCTEDLKKLEMTLQQRSGNLFYSCTAMSDYDIGTDSLKENIRTVSDDIHSNIQSMLDSFPRLSLLSYNRTYEFVKIWNFLSVQNFEFISQCMHEMYEHMGRLVTSYNANQRQYMCLGFVSVDDCEQVDFPNSIPFSLRIDEFLKQFEEYYRLTLAKCCDTIISDRIVTLKDLLYDVPSIDFISNFGDYFKERLKLLLRISSDNLMNQSIWLMNFVFIGEDIWTCLGHPTGGLLLARSDLVQEKTFFARKWKENLHALLQVCKDNVVLFQDMMQNNEFSLKMKISKSKKLISSLFQLELYFVELISSLYESETLESAQEFWAGRYQLKFVYDREFRTRLSPIDISLGCITVPYGMEYQGAACIVIPNYTLEQAVHKVVGSACAFRGSVFLSQENSSNATILESLGEYSISVRDIAAMLGRISSCLMSIKSASSIKFFLSRIIYLDAIGCVNLTSVDMSSLQNLIYNMGLFWSAIEKKNDFFIQESLKYPLKTKFSRNELQLERRKQNVTDLRSHMSNMSKNNLFVGMIVIGIVSESLYVDESALNYVVKSIFNIVPVPSYSPLHLLKVGLVSRGFVFGIEISNIIKDICVVLSNNFASLERRVCTSTVINRIIERSAQKLSVKLYFVVNNRHLSLSSRFLNEIECVLSEFWEEILVHRVQDDCDGLSNCAQLRRDVFGLVHTRLRSLLPSFDSEEFDRHIGSTHIFVPKIVEEAILACSKSLSLVADTPFVLYSSLFWDMLSTDLSRCFVICGDSGCGKSTIWKVVLECIRVTGFQSRTIELDAHSHRCLKSAKIVLAALKKWMLYCRKQRQLEVDDGKLLLDMQKRKRLTKKVTLQEEIEIDKNVEESKGEEEFLHLDSKLVDIIKSTQMKNSIKNLPRRLSPENKFATIIKNVKSTVVYHTSLSIDHLLGCFDGNNRWQDGLLLRILRDVDRNYQSMIQAGQDPCLHVVVLDGRIGSHIEQMFGSSFLRRAVTCIDHNNMSSSSVVFSSGEMHVLSPTLRIVFETHDIVHASPVFISSVPFLSIPFSSSHLRRRLLILWIKSLKHWLIGYSPWLDTFSFMENLLLTTDFVGDLVCHDFHAQDISSAILISRISSFLRILEECLQHCHAIVVKHAEYVKVNRDDESDSSSDSDNEDGDDDNDGNGRRGEMSMVLSLKHREKLLERVKLSIIYASLWGFGGCHYSAQDRKAFEVCLRDAISYIPGDVALPEDCSLFECVLDLENCKLEKSLQIHPVTKEIMINPGLPSKFENSGIYSDLVINSNSLHSSHRIQVHSPITRSLECIVTSLVASGSNIFVLGDSDCGKTNLINHILKRLGELTPSPQGLRSQIASNVVDIIYHRRPEFGIPNTISSLKRVLSTVRQTCSRDSTTASTSSYEDGWKYIQSGLSNLWSGGSKTHSNAKTLFSSYASIRSNHTADDLRSFFVKELASESSNVLEAPRYCFAYIFIDDFHLCCEDLKSQATIDNRPEGVIKGIIQAVPIFGIRKNLSPFVMKKKKVHQEDFIPGALDPPCIHRCLLSEPRWNSIEPNNYIIQPFGFLGAGNGRIDTLVASSSFQYVLPYMNLLSLAEFSIENLHAAIISGATTSLCPDISSYSGSIIEALKAEVYELSRMTLAISSKLASCDVILSPVEQTLKSLTTLNISLVSRFCESLFLGHAQIRNPGALLQLFAHEWKRYFLDPVPPGNFKSKIVSIMSDLLHDIDVNSWSITTEWLSGLVKDFATVTDRVWFPSDAYSTSAKTFSYLPVQINRSSFEMEYRSGTWDAEICAFRPSLDNTNEDRFDKFIDMSSLPCGFFPQSVLYPAAISMVCRLVRILNSSRRHILLAGHWCPSRITAIYLACRISNRDVLSFTFKESHGIVDNIPSNRLIESLSFKSFLKSVVMESCGVFPMSDLATNLGFKISSPRKITALIENFQSASSEDQRLLIDIVDNFDPMSLFEEQEIIYVAFALRKHSFKLAVDEHNQRQAAAQKQLLYLRNVQDQERKNLLLSLKNTKIDGEESHHGIDRDGNDLQAMENSSLDNEDSETEKPASSDGELKNTAMLDFSLNTEEFVDSTNYNILMTGYTFHWIKKYFKELLRSNLSIVLDTVISRPLCTEDIRSGNIDIKKPAMSIKVENKPTEDSNKSDSNIRSRKMSFASISDWRKSYHDNEGHLSLTSNTKSNHSLKNQSTGGIRDIDGSYHNFNSGTGASNGNGNSASGIGSTLSFAPIKLSSAAASSILSWSMLSSSLKRNFASIWWHIDPLEAVSGISHMMLQNEQCEEDVRFRSWYPLPLESTNIGVYVENEELNFPQDDETDKSTVSKNERLQQLEKRNAEKKRRLKFGNQSVVEHFNICITDSLDRNIINHFGLLGHLGILCFLPDVLAPIASFPVIISHKKTLQDGIAVMIEECRSLLPFLLSVPLPNDVLLLSQPILSLGSERVTEFACDVVSYIMKKFGSTILTRQLQLDLCLRELREANEKLSSRHQLFETVKGQSSNVLETIKQIDQSSIQLKQSIENIEINHLLSPEHESLLMMREEIMSLENNFIGHLRAVEGLLENYQMILQCMTHGDWVKFAGMVSQKPVQKEIIDIVRPLMAVVNYFPNKTHKGEKDKSGRLTDEAVAKYGAIMIKSQGFANQIGAINSSMLSASIVKALKGFNEVLYPDFMDVENGMEFKYLLSVRNNSENNELTVAEMLKQYLLCLEIYVRITQNGPSIRLKMISLQSSEQELRKKNLSLVESKGVLLRDHLNRLNSYNVILDGLLYKNKVSLDILQRLDDQNKNVNSMLHEFMEYCEIEKKQLDDLLAYIVGDCCIAAVIMSRCSWLAEEHRQEALKILRDHAISKNVKVSSTPYILGALLEKQQLRGWMTPSPLKNVTGNGSSNGGNSSLNSSWNCEFQSRDVVTINSISLLYLSPYFTFVVDPDGLAEQAMIDIIPTEYELCYTTAQKFTLAQLESWVQMTKELRGSQASICLLITETQSGASDDLISLLCSDFFVEKSTGTLRAKFNGQKSSGYDFMDLCGLRLYLFSTKFPVLMENGNGYPLPLGCFDHMCIVEWSCSMPSPVIEQDAMKTALFHSSRSDFALHDRFCSPMLQRISPDFYTNVNKIGNRILRAEKLIFHSFEKILLSIFIWSQGDKLDSLLPVNIPEYADYEAIPLGILGNELLVKHGMVAQKEIWRALYDLDVLLNLERDFLLYQSSFLELFSMTVDFVRVCSKFIPSELFPPLALSRKAIVSKSILPAIDKAQQRLLFVGIPTSFAKLGHIVRLITRIQRTFRSKRKSLTKKAPISGRSRNPAGALPMNLPIYRRIDATSNGNDGIRASSVTSLTLEKERPAEAVPSMGSQDPLSPSRSSKEKSAFASPDFLQEHRCCGLAGLQSLMSLGSQEEKVGWRNDLMTLMAPLRMFFLREVIDYLQSEIFSGMEWIVKFCCVLTVWTTSQNPPSHDEIKTLLALFGESMGLSKAIFVDVYALLPSTINTSAFQASMLRQLGSGDDEEEIDSESLVNCSEGVHPIDFNGSKAFAYDARSPNLSTIKNRKTAFRIQKEIFQRSGTNSLIDSSSSSTSFNEYRKLSDAAATCLSSPTSSSMVHSLYSPKKRSRWMNERYQRSLPGCLLHRQSTSWTWKDLSVTVGKTIHTNRAPSNIISLTSSAFGWDNLLTSRPLFRSWDMKNFVIGKRDVAVEKSNSSSKKYSFEMSWFLNKNQRLRGPYPEELMDLLYPPNKSSTNAFRSKSPSASPSNRPTTGTSRSSVMSRSSTLLSRKDSSVSSRGSRILSRKPSMRIREPTLRLSSSNSTVDRMSNRLSFKKEGLLNAGSSVSVVSLNRNPSQTRSNSKLARNNSNSSTSSKSSNSNSLSNASFATNNDSNSKLDMMVKGVGAHRKSLVSMDLSISKLQTQLSTSKQGKDKANEDSETPLEVSDHFLNYLQSSPVQQGLRLLENHAYLNGIYRGITIGMNDRLEEFAQWKMAVDSISDVDVPLLTDDDLLKLVLRIRPPMFQPLSSIEDMSNDHEMEGLWLQGKELSILQTMIFGEVLCPGSTANLAEVLFALICRYLKGDGRILQHQDEIEDPRKADFSKIPAAQMEMWDEEDDDEMLEEEEGLREDDEGEEENDHENDSTKADTTTAPWTPSSMLQSTKSSSSNTNGQRGNDALIYQSNMSFINSWTMLSALLEGSVHYKGSGYVDEDGSFCETRISAYRMTLRDYVDWEGVLFDCLNTPFNSQKFLFMKDLRTAMQGDQESLFLSFTGASNQMITLSQRARELGIHNGNHLSIFNCGAYSSQEPHGHQGNWSRFEFSQSKKNLRNQLVELNKTIKSSFSLNSNLTSALHSAIVEMVDLSSPFGNAVISTGLNASMTMLTGMIVRSMPCSQSIFDKERALLKFTTGNLYFASHLLKNDCHLYYEEDPRIDFSTAVKLNPPNANAPRKVFPLVLTSRWNSERSGRGPLQALSELHYSWLPRLFAPDILSTTAIREDDHKTFHHHNRFVGTAPLTRESASILSEELETSLLSVIACIRILARSTLTPALRDRLKYAKKLEIRATSGFVTLYRLIMYLHSLERESCGLSPLWGSCLSMPSLWQFTRLLLKISDILKFEWSTLMEGKDLSVEDLISHPLFSEAIYLCAESFLPLLNYAELSSSGNTAGTSPEKSSSKSTRGSTTTATSTSNSTSSGGPLQFALLSQNRRLRPTTTTTTSASIATIPAPPSIPSSRNRMTSTNMMSSLAVDEGKKKEASKKNSKDSTGEKDNSLTLKKDVKGEMSTKMRRQLRRIANQQAESLKSTLNSLRSIDRYFSPLQLHLKNSMGAPVELAHRLKKKMQQRLLSLFGHLLARIVVDYGGHSKAYSSVTIDNTFQNAVVMSLARSRRLSSKTDIASFLSKHAQKSGNIPKPEDNNESNGASTQEDFILQNLMCTDILLGALTFNDIVLCISRWSLDGIQLKSPTTATSNSAGSSVEKKKWSIIRAIRNSAYLIRKKNGAPKSK